MSITLSRDLQVKAATSPPSISISQSSSTQIDKSSVQKHTIQMFTWTPNSSCPSNWDTGGIFLDGNRVVPLSRGLNLIAYDSNFNIIKNVSYDVWSNVSLGTNLANDINSIPNGSLIAIQCFDAYNLNSDLRNALASIGVPNATTTMGNDADAVNGQNRRQTFQYACYKGDSSALAYYYDRNGATSSDISFDVGNTPIYETINTSDTTNINNTAFTLTMPNGSRFMNNGSNNFAFGSVPQYQFPITIKHMIFDNGNYDYKVSTYDNISTTDTATVDNFVYTPSLTLTPNNSSNYISMSWNTGDVWQKYSYTLYSKNSTDSVFQSIPSKNSIKVLNIYPENTMSEYKDGSGNQIPSSALVKKWMENDGYGKGLINVDLVYIDSFNANPNNYLKNADGTWKYDVVFAGAWDANNYKDLSDSSETALESYINSGRGFLFGHDTNTPWVGNPYFIKLTQKYADMYATTQYVNSSYGYSSIYVNKKGLLTNYPWNIGDVGTKLTVPNSHTACQFAMGDVWFKYSGNSFDGSSEVTSANGKSGTNNFYLTTYNNVAMIQTGHSNGQASVDEEKIMANTLFYLAQITDQNTWDDHKGQDVAAPNSVSISSVNKSGSNCTVNYSASADNGSSYQYYVKAIANSTGVVTTSDTKSATITSGLKGYAITTDKNATASPSTTVNSTSTSYSFTNSLIGNFYVHINAVDNVGNTSAVSNYLVDNTPPILSLSQSQPNSNNSSVVLTATATDADSGVKSITKPDGTIANSGSASYTVTHNGTYVFKAVDNYGNTITQSITVSSIDFVQLILNDSSINFDSGSYSKSTVVVVKSGSSYDLTMTPLNDFMNTTNPSATKISVKNLRVFTSGGTAWVFSGVNDTHCIFSGPPTSNAVYGQPNSDVNGISIGLDFSMDMPIGYKSGSYSAPLSITLKEH